MWKSPLRLTIYPTDLSESFRDMEEGETGLPFAPHPGAFGVERKHHVHEGVDLYCPDGTPVYAVEEGMVVAVLDFTGDAAGSPWWAATKAVLVEGDSGVVVYGEIETDLWLGDLIHAGDLVGKVVQVLTKDKGRPMSMLHLELHQMGTRDVYEWTVGERPTSLLDPTGLLFETITTETTVSFSA